jgi:hypothetical protein
MPKIKNDPANQIRIFQLNLSRLKFLSPGFLEEIMKKTTKADLGIERNNYCLIRTSAHVSWLQPTKELQLYHLLLMRCSRKGFNYLMIIKDK